MKNFHKNHDRKQKMTKKKMRTAAYCLDVALNHMKPSQRLWKVFLKVARASKVFWKGSSNSISGWYSDAMGKTLRGELVLLPMIPFGMSEKEKEKFTNKETGVLSMTNHERSQYNREKYGSKRLERAQRKVS